MDTHEQVWQVLGAWALDACDDDEPVGEVVAEAIDFCRLMAGSLAPSALRGVTSGEPGPVTDLLFGASRLGCDPDG